MMDNRDDDDGTQSDEWERLYERICDVLRRFGREDAFGDADFWVVEDNWGLRQHKIYLNNLSLLRPPIIKSLQRILEEFPSWEIMIAVSVRGPGEAWPSMGLTIRSHEIIDGLQRQFFSEEYRDIRYEGSRPGTDRD